MKIKPILTLFSIAISALIGYIIYSICDDENTNMMLLTIGSAVTLFVILFSGIGVEYNNNGSNANIKITSVVFTIVSIVATLILTFSVAGQSAIIIVLFSILLIYLLILYLLPKSKI